MSSTSVKHISERFIKPKYVVAEAKKPIYLGPMDLAMLSSHNIQKDDQINYSTPEFLDSLKDSLSHTLLSDILTPTHIPMVVQSFFDHDRAVNHDGHDTSLLTIQVTELLDGVFIGCSMNHVLGDGTS
ncbi:hypothetical protein RDABS01_026366 [Bienertia sinuspersici]